MDALTIEFCAALTIQAIITLVTSGSKLGIVSVTHILKNYLQLSSRRSREFLSKKPESRLGVAIETAVHGEALLPGNMHYLADIHPIRFMNLTKI